MKKSTKNILIFLSVLLTVLFCTSCKRYAKRELYKNKGDVCSYFVIKDRWTNKCGVVDEDNTLIVPIEYDSISQCSAYDSWNWGKSYTVGFEVSNKPLSEDEMMLYGLYNLSGDFIIPLRFTMIKGEISVLGEVGFEVGCYSTREIGVYNYEGDIIAPLRFCRYYSGVSAITKFNHLYWKIEESGGRSIIDNHGNIIIPPTDCDINLNWCSIKSDMLAQKTQFHIGDGYISLHKGGFTSIYSLKGECIIPFSRNYCSITGYYSGGRCFYLCEEKIMEGDYIYRIIVCDAHGNVVYRMIDDIYTRSNSVLYRYHFKYDAVRGLVRQIVYIKLSGIEPVNDDDITLGIMLDESNSSFTTYDDLDDSSSSKTTTPATVSTPAPSNTPVAKTDPDLLYKATYTSGNTYYSSTYNQYLPCAPMTFEITITKQQLSGGFHAATYKNTTSSGIRVYEGSGRTYYVTPNFDIYYVEDFNGSYSTGFGQQFYRDRIRVEFTKGNVAYDSLNPMPAYVNGQNGNPNQPANSSNSTTPSKKWRTVTRQEDCPQCYGTGNCSTCGGKGWYFGFGNNVACPNCHNHNGKCTKCGGSGKITKTEQVYE